MDNSCGMSGCPKPATLECTCKENRHLCKWHMRKHSSLVGCYYKSFNEADMMFVIKAKQNALNILGTKSIQLARYMINEIKKYLKKNLDYINKKKGEIYHFISKKKHEQADNILSWADSLQLLHRKRSDFECSMINLLCIDENSPKEITEIQRFKKRIEELESNYKEAKDTIQQQEKKIIKYKEKYSIKENEIKEIKKIYNETNDNLCAAEKKLKKWKTECQENHRIIKNYEPEKALNVDKKNNEEIKELANQNQPKPSVTQKPLLEPDNIIQDQKPKFVCPSVSNL